MGYFILQSPVGKLGATLSEESISKLSFEAEGKVRSPQTPLEKELFEQIQAFFSGELKRFDLPLNMQGTDFQLKVWRQLTAIPYGDTVTYGELSDTLHSSARAIGGACRRNPIPVIVPCHRVTSAAGIGGFSGQVAGKFIERKQWLLQHEKLAVMTE